MIRFNNLVSPIRPLVRRTNTVCSSGQRQPVTTRLRRWARSRSSRAILLSAILPFRVPSISLVTPALSTIFSYFHFLSLVFTLNKSQHSNCKMLLTTLRPDSFAEKISPGQRTQLIEWLSDHTYAESCELIALYLPMAS